nr:AT hook and Ankyrin domain containing protein [Haemonchus contortus]
MDSDNSRESATRQMFVPNIPATEDLAGDRSENSKELHNLIHESESDAESESSSEEEVHPGLIDFEEMSKGMDKATARIRKHLHDDTHIYSPTEQFLYKTMESDQGRMTRSRTRAMMDATPLPITYTPKQPRRSPRKTKKAFYSDDDPDDRALAEFLEQWRAESCSKSRRRRSASSKKTGRRTSCPDSTPKKSGKAEEPSVVECTCKRRRGRPRKISFSNASSSKESKVAVENDLGLGVHLECEPQVACIDAPPLQDHDDDDIVVLFDSCGNSGTPDPEYMPHSVYGTAESRSEADVEEETLDISLSTGSSGRRSLKNKQPIEPNLKQNVKDKGRKRAQKELLTSAVDVSHSSCDTENTSVCIPSTDDPRTPSTSYSSKRKRINKDSVGSSKLQKRRATRRTKSIELEADNSIEKSDSTPSLSEETHTTNEAPLPVRSSGEIKPLTPEKTTENSEATTSSSNKQDNLRPKKPQNTPDSQPEECKQSKSSPPSECVSASSSVVDIVELTLSKQQKIENAYSISRSKPQRVVNTRRYTGNKETVEKASNTSPPAESVKPMDVQQLLNSKLKARRSMAAHLPGPITYASFQEIRDEMYEDAVALYAPERPSFDPEELINAVRTGDVRRFRRATEHFCALNVGIDYGGMIYSVISKWRDEKGGTLIHLICRNIICTRTHESDDLITVLAKWAPELLRVQDTLLRIPLHLAVEGGEVCRVSTLLQLGSPVCWKDKNGLSPLEIAYSYGNGSVLKLLLNSGATFHELLASEERLPPLRRGHLFKMLARHSGIISGIMRSARKRILRNIFEIASLSPVLIAPFKDGADPIFRFTFSPSSEECLDRNSMQGPILFTYLAVNRPEVGKRGVEWSFRCHGPILCFAPTLNGRLLKPLTGMVQHGVQTSELLGDTFFFLCPLQSGINVLSFKLHESYAFKRIMLAAQDRSSSTMQEEARGVSVGSMIDSCTSKAYTSDKENIPSVQSTNNESETTNSGVSDAELMRNGTDKASDRTLKQLQYENHIYSPTEQFLYKVMELDTGRMTRSRTKVLMESTPPRPMPSKKQLCHKSGILKKSLSANERILGYAEILKGSQNDPCQEDGKKYLTENRRTPEACSYSEPIEEIVHATEISTAVDISFVAKEVEEGVCAYLPTDYSVFRPPETTDYELSTEVPSASIDPKSAEYYSMMDVACENSGREDEEMPFENIFFHSPTSSRKRTHDWDHIGDRDLQRSDESRKRTRVLTEDASERNNSFSSLPSIAGSSFDHGIPASSADNYPDILANIAHIHNDLQSQHYILSERSDSLQFPSTLEKADAFLSVDSATGVAFTNNQDMEYMGYAQSMHASGQDTPLNEGVSFVPDVSYLHSSVRYDTEASEQDATNHIPVQNQNDNVFDCNDVEQLPALGSCPYLEEIHEELYDEVVALFSPEQPTFDIEEMANAIRISDLKTFCASAAKFCALNKQADPNGELYSSISKWRDEYGGTLIHSICRNVRCSRTHEGDHLIQALVNWAPELLRVQDILLKLPLHLAVEKGQNCRVTTLLELGSPVSWLDCNSRSPLEIAYTFGNGIILKSLLNSGATFHGLVGDDEERLKSLKRENLLKILTCHYALLSDIIRDNRKKVLRKFLEVDVLSPIFIAPLKDGVTPVFKFSYNPSNNKIFGGFKNPILFTYLAVNRPLSKRTVDWSFRCYGPIRCFAPVLNGRLLEPMTGSKVELGVQTTELLTDTFLFFCPLQKGVNVLTFELDQKYLHTRIMFAAQVVMVGVNPTSSRV